MDTRFRAVKRLIDRNMVRGAAQFVRFPFFVIEPTPQSAPDQKMTDLDIKMQEDSRKLLISSNNSIKIFGDIELTNEIWLGASITGREC